MKGRRGLLWDITYEDAVMFSRDTNWSYREPHHHAVPVYIRRYGREKSLVCWPSEVVGKMYLQMVFTDYLQIK